MKSISLYHIVESVTQTLNNVLCNRVISTQQAWWILEALTKKSKAELVAQEMVTLSDAEHAQLAQWMYQLTHEHKPIQYILGTVPFLDLDLLVEPPILIPRPETEEWVSALIQSLKPLSTMNLRILDIGTGSGCIALALARALPHAHVVAVDVNPHALDLATRNAACNDVANVQFVQSNLFENISETFDLIVSNPPYISEVEYEQLDRSVSHWEDKRALVAHDDGLALIKKLIIQAPVHLCSNTALSSCGIPQLWIEIGYKQAHSVIELMHQTGYVHVTSYRDLAGNDRCIRGMLEQCGLPTSPKIIS